MDLQFEPQRSMRGTALAAVIEPLLEGPNPRRATACKKVSVLSMLIYVGLAVLLLIDLGGRHLGVQESTIAMVWHEKLTVLWQSVRWARLDRVWQSKTLRGWHRTASHAEGQFRRLDCGAKVAMWKRAGLQHLEGHERRLAEANNSAANDIESVAAKMATAALGEAIANVSLDPRENYTGPPITALDIRVGRVTKVWEHPEADKLFCEEIDVGEEEPRQIASGLRPYMTAGELEGRLVLVLANLKSRKLVGFPSHGMVLCASNKDHSLVKLVSPPEGAKIGERVTVLGFDFNASQPFAENQIAKKKVFEQLAPLLTTNECGTPEFLGNPFTTSAGVCTSPIAVGHVA